MPTYQFTAIDGTGQSVKDVVDATNEEEARTIIRGMGYFPEKIALKKSRKAAEGGAGGKKKRGWVLGRVNSKALTTFTRQLSTLQDAGLPIVRSLQILGGQCKPGALKYALEDTCEDIESGASLSEAMSKNPRAFDRLYVNMVKAGEAGGVLEIVLRRLAEFQEKAQSLKRKVKGAMVYPIVVILVALAILSFIMIYIVPKFTKMFEEFGTDLPTVTLYLVWVSNNMVKYWYLIPGIPIGIWLWIKLLTRFEAGRFGWDLFLLQSPVMGPIINKTVTARTTRTLGTLVASGVPILEGLHIARETSGNAVFEQMYGKIYDSVKEGESIAGPMKIASQPGFNLMALFFWAQAIPLVGALWYVLRHKQRVVDDIVVNMVDVGEETGELDKMLYKVADVYDEEVDVAVESLVSLLEPLMIVVLGGIVGFIVIALFMPLIKLIQKLSG